MFSCSVFLACRPPRGFLFSKCNLFQSASTVCASVTGALLAGEADNQEAVTVSILLPGRREPLDTMISRMRRIIIVNGKLFPTQ